MSMQLYAWGWGRYGNLGDGEKTDRWAPSMLLQPIFSWHTYTCSAFAPEFFHTHEHNDGHSSEDVVGDVSCTSTKASH